MRLSDLTRNESGIITKVRGRGAFRKRILEMGFVKGKQVTVVKNAPLQDPIEYKIMGYQVSLRRSEASLIEVITRKEARQETSESYNGVITDQLLKTTARKHQKTINIALVGNPNSGKTTLFNYASRSKEHVGNYGGVTVGSKMARYKQDGYRFNITDLPGTYSLSVYSPEELYVRKHILGEMPDIVINVVDASNLERNLYLTTQLIDMDIKVIIALNMYDELTERGDYFDYQTLGKMMGIPIIPTISSKGTGIKDLFRKAIEVFEDKDPTVRHIHINYGREVEPSLKNIQDELWKNKRLTDMVSSRFYAIKLLEKDSAAHFTLSNWENYHSIIQRTSEEIEQIEGKLGEDSEAVITDAKYAFIAGALKETYKGNMQSRYRTTTNRIDRYLTHKFLGFPIFLFFMWIMFQATFTLGSYPMEWIDTFVGYAAEQVNTLMSEGPLKDLIINGIIDGVGGVIIFLPNILILFFFISFMEDTGYMARAAFIMDKIMHKVGLHGQSFIPLLMGFGCNVPAIMSTRTIKNRNNRLLTILINPFMSCSARLPVYVLIISAFFTGHPGTILFSVYLFGILMAGLVAIIFKRTLFRTEEVPFVMELPPYRMPTLKNTARHMWNKGSQYVKKMGGVILVASIIIWALGYFPRQPHLKPGLTDAADQQMTLAGQSDESPAATAQKTNQGDAARQKQDSYIVRIGRFVAPVMRPLGFDWKMSVSLISGIAAKEIVVSTMGVLYQGDEGVETNREKLIESLRNARYEEGPHKGEIVFDTSTALSFLIFVLLYFPCVAALAAIQKETGSWRWSAFAIIYTTALAWIVAYIVHQIAPLVI
ncbi:MAG: ferrous iron transport protein B [Bacteroidales bacterium]|nr:ferrous iron transport protein B [Bacteroidales bacterium]